MVLNSQPYKLCPPVCVQFNLSLAQIKHPSFLPLALLSGKDDTDMHGHPPGYFCASKHIASLGFLVSRASPRGQLVRRQADSPFRIPSWSLRDALWWDEISGWLVIHTLHSLSTMDIRHKDYHCLCFIVLQFFQIIFCTLKDKVEGHKFWRQSWV